MATQPANEGEAGIRLGSDRGEGGGAPEAVQGDPGAQESHGPAATEAAGAAPEDDPGRLAPHAQHHR